LWGRPEGGAIGTYVVEGGLCQEFIALVDAARHVAYARPVGRGARSVGRRAASVAALLGALALFAPPIAGASRAITFEANGGPAQVKPATLYASPTNGPFAKRLQWSDWGTSRATATGTTYYDTCEPNCSAGYHSTSGEVILSGVHSCDRHLRYSLLRIIYLQAPEYDLRATYDCSGEATHVHIG
jgi:hypothetical protein